MARQRFPMRLLVAFAGLAFVLAFVGTHAVISYSSTRRVHEIGTRMTLGAEKHDVLRAVLGQGLARAGWRRARIGSGVHPGTIAIGLFSPALRG